MSDRSILFVVNPEANAGRTGKNWEKTYENIKKTLNITSDYVIANGISTGLEKTLDGIKEGYTDLIAVGGDGALNEVTNGIYQSGKSINLGFIRGGTVNDYLTSTGWPDRLDEQVELINKGITKLTPITKVTGDTERICLNVADTGVGSLIAYSASVERRLKWVKGELRYTLLSLRGVLKWKNIPATLKMDDREVSGDLSFFMSGFSTLSGAYKVLPHAERFGEKMAYTIALNFNKIKMIKNMGVLKKGEQTEEIEGIYMGHSSKIRIEGEKDLLFEVDGEPFSFNSSTVELESIPNAIQVFVK